VNHLTFGQQLLGLTLRVNHWFWNPAQLKLTVFCQLSKISMKKIHNVIKIWNMKICCRSMETRKSTEKFTKTLTSLSIQHYKSIYERSATKYCQIMNLLLASYFSIFWSSTQNVGWSVNKYKSMGIQCHRLSILWDPWTQLYCKNIP